MRRLLLITILLAGCTPKPPDVYVFEHLSQRLSTNPANGHLILTPSPTCMKKIQEVECGHGVSIVSGAEIFVGEAPKYHFRKKPWSQLKRESVYVPAEESYAPLAAYIINSCKKMNCSEDVTRFKVKLDSLNGIPGAIGN
jgi:hypothetical protein